MYIEELLFIFIVFAFIIKYKSKQTRDNKERDKKIVI